MSDLPPCGAGWVSRGGERRRKASVDMFVDISGLRGIWIRSEIQCLLTSRVVLVMGVVDSSAGKG